MARFSERRERLKCLRRVLRFAFENNCMTLVLAVADLYGDLVRTRYLFRGPYRSLNRTDFVLEFMNLREEEFIALYRMTRDSFTKLTKLLKRTAAVKQSMKSPRAPDLWKVVACGVYRLGHYGNSSSIAEVGFRFRIASGTVLNWTSLLIAAIIEVSARYIKWPDAAERAVIADKWHKLGAPKATFVGAVDGTLIMLRSKPAYQTARFMSRKGQAVNIQIIVDCECNIIAVSACFAGTVHDSTAFSHMPHGDPAQNATYYSFPDGTLGCCIADAGYPSRLATEPTLTTRDQLTQDEAMEMWNLHSKLRNVSERVNGQVCFVFGLVVWP
jgi:hypothetical protein